MSINSGSFQDKKVGALSPTATGSAGGFDLRVRVGRVGAQDACHGVSQNIAQLQNVEVNAINNVGVIGAGFGPLKLDVSPSQWAYAGAAF